MIDKIKIELGGVQRTMLFPLWSRAIETMKKKPLLIDKTAVEVVAKIDFDFDAISKESRFVSHYGFIRRSLLIDNAINQFLNKHPKATIVDIGCGLDTTFERVDNGFLRWYDLDLPDIIDLRKKFIQESNRRQFINSSFLDYNWFDKVIVEDNILFIAAGVFYYFEEYQIKDFFLKIIDKFPDSELVFDINSSFGVKMSNKMFIKKIGFDEKSFLKWGLKSSESIKQWDNRIKVISEVSLFKDGKKGVGLKSYFELLVAEILWITRLVHVKIKKMQ